MRVNCYTKIILIILLIISTTSSLYANNSCNDKTNSININSGLINYRHSPNVLGANNSQDDFWYSYTTNASSTHRAIITNHSVSPYVNSKWIKNGNSIVTPSESITYRYYVCLDNSNGTANNTSIGLNLKTENPYAIKYNGVWIYGHPNNYLPQTNGTYHIINSSNVNFNMGSGGLEIFVFGNGSATLGRINVSANIINNNSALYDYYCCSPTPYISGSIRADNDGDYNFSGSDGSVGEGEYTVTLYDQNNGFIADQTVTNFFYFIPPTNSGTYKISCVPTPATRVNVQIRPSSNSVPPAEKYWIHNVTTNTFSPSPNNDFLFTRVYYKGEIIKPNIYGTGCRDYDTKISVVTKKRNLNTGQIEPFEIENSVQHPNSKYFTNLNGRINYQIGNSNYNPAIPDQYKYFIWGSTTGDVTYSVPQPPNQDFQTRQTIEIEYSNNNDLVPGYYHNGAFISRVNLSGYQTIYNEFENIKFDCCPTFNGVYTEFCITDPNPTLSFSFSGIGPCATNDCGIVDADVEWIITDNANPNVTTTYSDNDLTNTSLILPAQYRAVGEYLCTLKITIAGCTTQSTKTIKIFDAVGANIISPTNISAGNPAQFTANGFNPSNPGMPGTIIDSWEITKSGSSSVIHQDNNSTLNYTFLEGGTYDIHYLFSFTLSGLCFTRLTKTVNVAGPIINPNFNSACINSPIIFNDFRNTTSGTGLTPTSYIWDFGDGNTNSVDFNPSHSFTNPGIKTVTLTANYFNPSVAVTETMDIFIYDPTPNVTIPSVLCYNPPTPGAPVLLSHSVSYNPQNPSLLNSSNFINWDFDDGTVVQDVTNVNHNRPAGTHSTILTSTFSNNCSSIVTNTTKVDQPFVGVFSSVNASCINEPVNFFPVYSSEVESNPSNILWDFDDGTTSTALNPSHSYTLDGTYDINVTTTTSNGCTATSTLNFPVEENLERNLEIIAQNNYCLGSEVQFSLNANEYDATSYDWTFGNGLTSAIINPKTTYLTEGTFTVSVTGNYSQNCISNTPSDNITITVADYDFCSSCDECIGSFAPKAGEKYVLSAWVKEANEFSKSTYNHAAIAFDYEGSNQSSPNYKAQGAIIEGWQMIEREFTIPENTSAIQIKLLNLGDDDVFFDDIRIYPFNANLKSFVYDPITMRLTAELDENNYATFYEYDEDGNLIRVKKETERGVKTIQETVKRVKQDD